MAFSLIFYFFFICNRRKSSVNLGFLNVHAIAVPNILESLIEDENEDEDGNEKDEADNANEK